MRASDTIRAWTKHVPRADNLNPSINSDSTDADRKVKALCACPATASVDERASDSLPSLRKSESGITRDNRANRLTHSSADRDQHSVSRFSMGLSPSPIAVLNAVGSGEYMDTTRTTRNPLASNGSATSATGQDTGSPNLRAQLAAMRDQRDEAQSALRGSETDARIARKLLAAEEAAHAATCKQGAADIQRLSTQLAEAVGLLTAMRDVMLADPGKHLRALPALYLDRTSAFLSSFDAGGGE